MVEVLVQVPLAVHHAVLVLFLDEVSKDAESNHVKRKVGEGWLLHSYHHWLDPVVLVSHNSHDLMCQDQAVSTIS
jgi:hypothetical protein